jgi:hypothetical protein
MKANKFRNILAGDESWFMLEYQHGVKWSLLAKMYQKE